MKKPVVAAIAALTLAPPVEAQERKSVAPRAMQAVAPGLAGYKDAGERRYSSSCTAGTSGGRPGKASHRTRDAMAMAEQQNAAELAPVP